MNRQIVSAIALAVAALSAGQALAQDATPKTREQVRAELAEAIRNGDMVADGQTGATYRDLFPGRYPAETTLAQGKTRADVKAELAEAVRNGDIVAGDHGKTLRELNPSRYPVSSMN